MKWLFVLIVTFICYGVFSYNLGVNDGKKQGYSICVSEEDDDHVRTRKF